MKLRIILFASLVVWAVSSPVPPKQYRSDYEYNKSTDAFYKLHTKAGRLAYASNKCIEEGGELVKATSYEDLEQVRALIKKFPDLEASILLASDVTVSDNDSKNDCDVLNRHGDLDKGSRFQDRRFVCKVAAKDTSYNEECGVFSNGYESISATGSCYRVSTVEANWDEAHANCQAEGAHLVILSSDEELEVLYNMLKDKPHNSETQYFAGVRADTTTEPRVFKTVLNQSLEEVGYGPWEEGEPNKYEYGENCVVLDTRRHGKYNDIVCHNEMPYVCEVSVASLPAPSEVAASDASYNKECGVYSNDYVSKISTTGSCYRVSTVEATWDEANAICQAEGAHLVILSSDEELKFLYNMLQEMPHDSETQYFAGVRADTTTVPKMFKTVLNQSFEDVGYGPWEEGEPNEYEYGANCVVLDTRRHGKYNDIVCHNKMPYVCEVSVAPLLAPSKVAASDAPYNKECGVYSNDYVSKISNTGSCYRVSTVEATWDEANAICQDEGAHLVILSSDEELKFLYNMLQEVPHDSETQYFAGVRADTTTVPKMFKTVLNQSFEDVGYGPWEEGEPNEYEYGENCVVLDTRRHGKYNDIVCHNKMPYVCEVSVAPLPAPSKVAASDAPYNKECGVYSNDYVSKISTTGSCYRVSTVEATWDEANAICQDEGAHLVILSSDEELKFLYNMLQEVPHDSETQYFAGVRADTTTVPKMFKTVLNQSFEDVGYGPWEEGEPNEYEYGENCVVLDTRRHGKYNDIVCHIKMPYVCEVSIAPLPAPSKVAASDAPYNKECGVYSNDYVSKISTTGSCYRVSTVEATWDEANAICQDEGAHLVILSSDEELKFLYNMLQEVPHDSETQYFAGVRADTTTVPKMFKTVLNQSFEDVGYGPWEEGEPNEYEYGENCVVLDTRRHGKYNDIVCHNKMPYVCEVSVAPLPAPSTVNTDKQMPEVPVPAKQYRPDYEYDKNTDAFYKLHTKGASYFFASEICNAEGAELVRITSEEVLKQILTMMKKLSDLEDYVMVVSDDESDALRPYSPRLYRWNSECKVVNRRGKIDTTTSRQQLPFVCKVAARDAPYDKECGVYSNDYVSRMSKTGSCYKVSTTEATWNEANANCQADGAHLVILSSDEELQVLYNMLIEKPHDSETQYFAGVRADTTTVPKMFKTVLNQILKELEYEPWDENEPNDYEGGENCVALDTRRHGKYNDVWCNVRMPYVCESSGKPLEINATPSTLDSVIAVPVPSKQYRPDYEYNEYTDAFYKLHTKGASKYFASEKCEEEGAEIVKITSAEDLKQVHAMMKKLSVLEDYVMIASNVNSDDYSPNYAKVVNRKGEIETTTTRQKLPFVCKVAAKNAPYNKECGVYSNDYESRISTTGSCYRVSTTEATWNEAHADCQADGAHLVILSSDEELKVLYNMLKEKPHDSETQYFAGLRADTTTEPRMFKTILNQTLEEVGYGPWDEGEPNDYEGGENCVALDTRRHGKYNDVWCNVRMPYVCESSGVPREISSSEQKPSNIVSAVPVSSKKYRPDYEYNKNTDAFYKLHTEEATSSKIYATAICKGEGAELTKITSDEDVKQIHSMMKTLSDLEEYVMVASDGDPGPSNWTPESKVVNRRGKIETTTSRQELPFVCKVAASDAPYDENCGVYSNDYEARISTTGSCYRVSNRQATWNEAQTNCQAEGAHLVILNSDEEFEVVYNVLKNQSYYEYSYNQYFAGIRADTTTEPRVFKTVLNQTLQEVGYVPWNENEPNDYEGGENCVALDGRRNGKYNDVWCHVRMLYVCESSGAPLEISETPSTPNSVSAALNSAKQYRLDYEYNKNTDSFYKLHAKGASKFDASNKCEAEGAELVKISSDEDLKQVHAMLKKLSDLEDYVMVASDVVSHQYSGSDECNVVNRKGKMEKTTARQELPFVCKAAAKDAPDNKECGVYSNDYESKITTTGSCYRVSTVEATWNEAYANCQAEGAHLVILNSDEEVEVLYNMLKDKPHDSETQYFAGVKADTMTEPRMFKTVLNQTLEEVGYGPWDENEPNDYEGGENCVALDTRRHGKYNDVWCNVRMLYVCESFGVPRKISTTPSTPNTVPAVPAPSKQYRPGYEYNKNSDAFYKLHIKGGTKSYASSKCVSEGADLVKIASDEDLKQVYNMLKRLSDLQDLIRVATDVVFDSADHESNVVTRRGKIEKTTPRQMLPFVCKVAAKDALYNEECGVYSNDYESRITTTGSCYRVVTRFYLTWDEAQADCQSEGAHLVILNSDEELEVLYNMLKDKPQLSGMQYFAGVRADTTTEPRVFKTVLNQTLDEVGYGQWDENEPNNYEGGENCVALDTRRHGKYNDVWCHVRMPYVCESTGAPWAVHPTSTTSVPDPVPSAVPKVYRPDYEYNEKTDAFYKLHPEGRGKHDATVKCVDEGAELLKIMSNEDLYQVRAMMKEIPNLIGPVIVASTETPVQIDIRLNIDELDRNAEVNVASAYQELPFVCKVAAKDVPYNEECDVYSNDYESKISTTGSCYRVSTAEATWDEAYANSQAEGAHLVILSSDKELEVLYNMLKEKPHDSETQYFTGVTADTTTQPRVFKTVFNQTLEEVGYGPWEKDEPNDYYSGENCVVLDTRRQGKYNDVWCHVRMPYVYQTLEEVGYEPWDEGEPNDYHTGEDCVALDTRRQAKYNDVWCYVKMNYVCESSGKPQEIRAKRRTSGANPQTGFPVTAIVMTSMYSLFSIYFA